jgi:uncharacterized protein YndB with AHSA1/START domain
MVEIDVTAVSSAPRQAVWALLADAGSWPRWSTFEEADVEGPDGIGQLRTFRGAGVARCEQVVVFEPGRRLGSRLHSGLPVRDHHAEVTLVPRAGGGTAIRWRTVYRPAVPGTGWLLRRQLQPALTQIAADLAEAACDGLRPAARPTGWSRGRTPAVAGLA